MAPAPKLRVAFIHPDLGIGGAERLVVDAALGLQSLGHSVDLYTSHHDKNHCFDETRDGTLRVHHIISPFPRSWNGKFHILFAHARQLHLTKYLLSSSAPQYDVFFVDQLSTCIPLLRIFAGKRVLFYCHFPDKLLAYGAFVEGKLQKKDVGLLKTVYRYPMDWLEEITTRQADLIVANSNFTARVTTSHLTSIQSTPKVVYPGINIKAYQAPVNWTDPDIVQVTSQRPTLISLNRFEMKKNAALAIEAFALLRDKPSVSHISQNMRLVLAGGYDPRVEDNIRTLNSLIERARASKLTFNVITPPQAKVSAPSFAGTTTSEPDILFLLNFTTSQRSALLQAPSTLALLYTPANEHFGIGPVEGMICGLPILACDSGGPTESVVDQPSEQRTGWLRTPVPTIWSDALEEICRMGDQERAALAQRSKHRAESVFGMDSMAKVLEEALVETVAMGPVQAPVKEFAFLLAFLVGLVLAVLSRL
ncbi:glycosyltransferase family 4 protein [Hydnomerulius pinastri MD-312]|uniref:Alpha-1,3/1,6-mannosyltransferase ALG2 n=1 Tax=Hydnomerulius pinastri MD-312 TaxID=994086 RepID=A0A0C9VCQ5_9AGAM|nr:glycosyltransferase family 4 protein [Hydnomerulius pinastri MD-312]